jgi:Pathogenicity locus
MPPPPQRCVCLRQFGNANNMSPRDPLPLESLPNIGRALAADLRALGIEQPEQLSHTEPFALYSALANVMEKRHDPCVFYTLLAVQNFLRTGEKQPWWVFAEAGKRQLAAYKIDPSRFYLPIKTP